MEVIKRKDGRHEVRVPRKHSPSGKRESRYFKTSDDAEDFIKQFKDERREHGRQVVTATERRWLGYWRERVGSFDLMPEIVNFWKRSGEGLKPIATMDAVKVFTNTADAEYSNRRTLIDIVSRLRRFGAHFGTRPLHEVSVADIESYLTTFKSGWNRWSHAKRLRPFYQFARRHRWVPVDPMEEIPTPRTPDPERQIYTVEQFQKMLHECEELYPPLLPFIVLCGFCFLRTSEIIRAYKEEKVLQWSDLLWEDSLIHVRPGVSKGTKRESDERYIPLSDAAKRWLAKFRNDTGDCVKLDGRTFSKLWQEMTDGIEVPRIPNGLRHSCISYSIAANPTHGFVLTAQWSGNSEATIRKHYRRLIKPKTAAGWFEIPNLEEHWARLDAEYRRPETRLDASGLTRTSRSA
jgi:integrase